jgi:hypothetical protein
LYLSAVPWHVVELLGPVLFHGTVPTLEFLTAADSRWGLMNGQVTGIDHVFPVKRWSVFNESFFGGLRTGAYNHVLRSQSPI